VHRTLEKQRTENIRTSGDVYRELTCCLSRAVSTHPSIHPSYTVNRSSALAADFVHVAATQLHGPSGRCLSIDEQIDSVKCTSRTVHRMTNQSRVNRVEQVRHRRRRRALNHRAAKNSRRLPESGTVESQPHDGSFVADRKNRRST
jgi:hypothetical protein